MKRFILSLGAMAVLFGAMSSPLLAASGHGHGEHGHGRPEHGSHYGHGHNYNHGRVPASRLSRLERALLERTLSLLVVLLP